MTLSEKLKGIVIPKFHPVAWDEVLMRVSIEEECGYHKSLIRCFLGLIRDSFLGFYYDVDYKVRENSSILAHLFQTNRQGYIEQFNNISNLSKADILVERVKRKKFGLIFLNFLTLVFVLYPIWFISMRNTTLSLTEKLLVLRNLRPLYGLKLFIDTIDIKKYKLLTCFYDSIVSSNYLLHVFKLNKITTATLQHGCFQRYKTNLFELSGVEFRSSYSDYFLVWNNYQLTEAIAQGIPNERIKVVGILGFLGIEKVKCINPHSGIFGVSISHPSWESENFAMIKAANILAKATGLKYKLKLHPNYPETYFERYVDLGCYLGNVPKGISMLDYANSVDFTIVGSSSVLNEMAYLYHHLIRYSSGSITDKFVDVSVGYKFSDLNDIIATYQTMLSRGEEDLIQMYNCFGSVDDITKEYLNFFCSFN